ncbi:hypothetical protein [Actinoallomurus soli]|uniref:hypothetical protein n=1 Tax=Actinoallomurus soli TaxID=2952535 RepID=UPI002092AEB7|nr:hypothetical protein [Actinoallomurus soli]MCO5972277.1 hypothetical protein [Actinoallomurus soli]
MSERFRDTGERLWMPARQILVVRSRWAAVVVRPDHREVRRYPGELVMARTG